MNNILRYTLIFIVVVALQVLLFNNINLFGLVNIYIYLIFLLALPAGMSKELQLLLAFLLGLCIDIFTNTLGLHIFATVFVAFFRNPILKWAAGKDLEANVQPSIKTIGFVGIVKYSLLIIFLHHLVLFPLEDLQFVNIGHTLLMVLCSVPASFVFTLCYFLLKKK